jgi:hypothetical protein
VGKVKEGKAKVITTMTIMELPMMIGKLQSYVNSFTGAWSRESITLQTQRSVATNNVLLIGKENFIIGR